MTSDRELVGRLGRVGQVFFSGFDELRSSQRESILPILSGEDVLLACPTASGKTEAVFAPMIKRLTDMPTLDRSGTCLLTIAPTRALVNDLFARVSPLMENLGLTCGRQTSDHRQGRRPPFLLITTPESVDSMLARRTEFDENGNVSGHLLDTVVSVFIDEAHLFDNTARGDHVVWLLERLRRVRRFAASKENVPLELQVCGASATVSSPGDLACRLLGPKARVLLVPGGREIQVFAPGLPLRWVTIEQDTDVRYLGAQIPVIAKSHGKGEVASVIWQALEKSCDPLIRKMLIFVPSRSYCDELSGYLKEYLRERRDIAVYAHHGSLDKQIREGAEQEFSSSRDAVLVATSTLEVGVDIGDVDAVALVGPPADTNSLLQRIGRSGRRSGITRVLAIARSDIDRVAMSSMLVAARNGLLDPVPYGRRWSVCVQQIGSYIKQAPGKGRRVIDIAELAETVWPGNGAKNAEAIVQLLHDDGYVAFANDRLHHGEQWADIWSGMGLHGNFDSGNLGTPVIDSVTGETIAHIPQGSAVENKIAIGGSNWTVIRSRDELLLEPLKRGSSGTAVRYSARKAPTGRSFARHISIGLGFADNEILGIEYQGCSHWFHFGGSAYELLLLSLMTKLERVDGLAGITSRGDFDLLEVVERITPDKVKTLAIKQMKSLSGLFAPGPFHKMLPVSLQEETLLELLSPESFCAWLQSRRIRLITPEHQQFSTLSAILASV